MYHVSDEVTGSDVLGEAASGKFPDMPQAGNVQACGLGGARVQSDGERSSGVTDKALQVSDVDGQAASSGGQRAPPADHGSHGLAGDSFRTQGGDGSTSHHE